MCMSIDLGAPHDFVLTFGSSKYWNIHNQSTRSMDMAPTLMHTFSIDLWSGHIVLIVLLCETNQYSRLIDWPMKNI